MKCSVCGSESFYMGRLGIRHHFRCWYCGGEWSIKDVALKQRLGEAEDGDISFQRPSENSALRLAMAGNPRNLPCPTCGKRNRLTPADRALHYQCDDCADELERGG